MPDIVIQHRSHKFDLKHDLQMKQPQSCMHIYHSEKIIAHLSPLNNGALMSSALARVHL